MKTYKERIIPQRIEKVLESRTCDLCGRKASTDSWDAASFDVRETEVRVEVRHKKGTTYPDSGWAEEIVVDLCPKCFVGKLVPWLESQGVSVNVKESDW